MTPRPKSRTGTISSVPNQPKTPQRTFRLPDPLVEAARTKAKKRGETLTDVVRRKLEEYVAEEDPKS